MNKLTQFTLNVTSPRLKLTRERPRTQTRQKDYLPSASNYGKFDPCVSLVNSNSDVTALAEYPKHSALGWGVVEKGRVGFSTHINGRILPLPPGTSCCIQVHNGIFCMYFKGTLRYFGSRTTLAIRFFPFSLSCISC